MNTVAPLQQKIKPDLRALEKILVLVHRIKHAEMLARNG
jgi:hypothetical protein